MGHYAEGDTHGYTREDAELEEREYMEAQAKCEEILLQVSDVLRSHNRHHMKAPDHEQAVEAIRGIVTQKGQWLDVKPTYPYPFKCSVCGHANSHKPRFCSCCGALNNTEVKLECAR